MKKLAIVTDESQLRYKCAMVRAAQIPGLLPAIQQMLELCRDNNGAALAAPQVGVPLRFFLAMSRDQNDTDFDVLFNPSYKPMKSHGKAKAFEGCLSYPGKLYEVERWKCIKMTWFHYNEKTKSFRKLVKTFEDFLARMAQHEIDHLDGIVASDLGREVNPVISQLESGNAVQT